MTETQTSQPDVSTLDGFEQLQAIFEGRLPAAPIAETDRTSLLSVCRSTRMNRRQPIRWYHVSVVQPHGLARR